MVLGYNNHIGGGGRFERLPGVTILPMSCHVEDVAEVIYVSD